MTESILSEEGKLKIFERFVIDKSLPKHAKVPDEEIRNRNRGVGRNQNTAVYTGGSYFTTNDTTLYVSDSSATSTSTSVIGGSTDRVLIVSNYEPQSGDNIPPTSGMEPLTPDHNLQITIQEFFGYLRHAGGLLSNLRYRRKVKNIQQLIDQTLETGQIALKDLAMNELDRIKLESLLCANGFKVYLTEQNIALLYGALTEGTKDIVVLEWMKNFCRVIPPKILKRKKKADKLHVFDNYVVLHIKPEWYGKPESRETKKEQDDRKDPILFGVMECSRRLYYIGDWIDEYCHLTLGEAIEALGDDHLLANNSTARLEEHLIRDLRDECQQSTVVSEVPQLTRDYE